MSISDLSPSYILGIDLGAESIGWLLLDVDGDRPTAIRRAGTHCFDAAVEGDLESGKDESKAKARRDASGQRRQHWRRAWRRRKVLRTLQQAGLMPPGSLATPTDIHERILRLDQALREKFIPTGDRVAAHLLPYRLRAKALDECLEPFEVGRALYHLAQRRGFLSNRKAGKKGDDEGMVKAAISELSDRMTAAGARTLGEYFSGMDPEEERIRKRWTSRQMYLDEFEKIWTKQAEFHPQMTDEVKAQIHAAIFFQRPLKPQTHLIGVCDCDPPHRRAPVALRLAQRFRLLQKVNDLEVLEPTGFPRPLSSDERAKLIAALEQSGDLTFAKIRGKSILALPKETSFNLEKGGEKKLPGHRTDAKLAEIFGDKWPRLSEAERDQIVEDILTFEKSEALAARAQRAYGLDREAALRLAELELEPGYAMHCRKVLRQLVAKMEGGTRYAAARRELYPDQFQAKPAVDLLPPVKDALRNLRNPAVCRALTELRKLINAIIRRYGKPAEIHIELARDLKRSRKDRQELSKVIRENEKLREKAKERILRELGDQQPTRADIEKVLLAEECGWECPYTGKRFGMQELLGQNPQFDVEHIIPLSRSLDNSFGNKTLCYHEENRNHKRNRTPWEAYHADEQRWHQILERVRRFQGASARGKMRRFLMEAIPDDFTSRQLNDTRYASRLAAEYVGLLYGGRADAEHRQRVYVCTGGTTAFLRNEWKLNTILGDGGPKTRDDHRHHAVDALVIALTGPATVKMLADAADNPWQHRRRLFAPIQEPWVGFLDQAREAILRINVSHRVNRRVAGPLHDESIYSPPQRGVGSSPKVVPSYHIRKPLASLSIHEVEDIVDPIIRARVKAVLDEKGGDPKKVFSVAANLPALRTRDGRTIPIRKARIRKSQNMVAIGKGPTQRYVAPGSNHHMAIVAKVDSEGNDREWEGVLVSRLEAAERARRRVPVVQREWGEGRVFRFSLAPGEMFTLEDGNGKGLYIVRSISQNRVEFVKANDARKKVDIKAAKHWLTHPPSVLFRKRCQKVSVGYLGDIVPAND